MPAVVWTDRRCGRIRRRCCTDRDRRRRYCCCGGCNNHWVRMVPYLYTKSRSFFVLVCRFLLEDCWIASCIVLERMIQKSLVRPVRSGVVSVLWTIIDFGSFVCCFDVSFVCCCFDAKDDDA